MALALMATAFTLNDYTPTNNNQRSSSNPSNMQIAQLGMNMDQDRHMLMVKDNVKNQFRLNAVQNVRNHYGIGNVVTARAEGNGNDTTTDCSKRRSRDQLNSEEFYFMAAADAYNKIEEVNTDCTLKVNLQQASPSGTQTDSAPVMIQMDQL
nr:hypothetical protein [Tanacetum cinerariifolium]